MRISLGIICLLFGGVGYLGQVISVINFPLAQKLGLQEKNDHAEKLFLNAERNTARWDFFVLWTLPVAGLLMLLNSPWWPHLSLIAGGVYLDAGGREFAKYFTLHKEGVKVGSTKDVKIAYGMYLLMGIVALFTMGYALFFLTT